jgi:hypothetical protein
MIDIITGVTFGGVTIRVFITAGFTLPVGDIAPLTGIAVFRAATGIDTMIIDTNFSQYRTISIVVAFFYTAAVLTTGKLGILDDTFIV